MFFASARYPLNYVKKFYCALLFVLVLCSSAFALTDKEYISLRRGSKEFARADAELNQLWDELKDTLTARQFETAKKDQARWIKSGRDAYARRRMKAGLSKARAYTEATQARIDELLERYMSDAY